MIITGHLPHGVLHLLCHLPTSSLSHILGGVTPVRLPGCDAPCSGGLSWSIKLGWGLILDVDAPSRSPQVPLLFLCTPPCFLLFSPLEGLCSPQLARTTALGPLGLACVECQRMCVSALAAAPNQRLEGRESESSASLVGTNSETWLTQPVAYIRTFKLWTFKMWTPLYASCCIALLCFSRHYMERLKMFSLRTHGCWREGIVRDFGKVMYARITNKDLLYSTWHSAQCYMPAGMGGGFGGNMNTCVHTGFPGSAAGKKIPLKCRRPRFDAWVGKIPWRRERLPTAVFLPGPSMGLQRVRLDWMTFTFTSFHTYGWVPLLFAWNYNIVNRLYSNTK